MSENLWLSAHQPFSRRSFLARAAFSGTFLCNRPWALRASPPLLAACQFKARSPFSPTLAKFISKVPPGTDEFLCEKYASDIDSYLRELSTALCASPSETAVLARLVSADLIFSSLNDAKVLPLRETGPIRVEKIQFNLHELRGRSTFLDGWKTYISGFTRIACAEFQITGLRIRRESPAIVETDIRYDIVGNRTSGPREERTGEWTLEWRWDPSGGCEIHRWQATAETRSSISGPGFVEITADCLRGNASYEEQMLRGVDYWRTMIDAASGIDVYGNNGIAVGDFDGNGFDDFYVCQPSGLPNRLYRNRGDGTFEDVTEASGVGVLDGTASALFADFTNSGTQDLLVVRTSGPLLFLNRGAGRFELKPDAFQFAKPPAGTFTGVAAADYDRDGLLDIYFCLYAYYQGLSQYTHPRPYYDAENGPPNFLLRNRGGGTFEDVTESSGMNQNNNRFTFACAWCDYDNDGWPDLYVANDFGRKNFYRNNGNGTFTDIAHEVGVEDHGAGMSVSWLDYDNDGRQDVYVANMWSAAGKRVTTQDCFLPGVDYGIRETYRKHASGNSLFHNEGGNRPLLDATGTARVAMGRWSWSADAWDFDHDGYSDLYVTNGFISGADRRDLSSFFWRQIVARSLDTGSSSVDYQLAWNAINELIRSDCTWNGYERNVFFLNNHDGSFSEVSGPTGLDFEDDSRAFALADFDHDGRLEVILKNRNAPQLRILHNELHPIGNAVFFCLRGRKSNRDAIGAVVTLESSSTQQVKFVQAGSGFLSQHTKELTFGIGSQEGTVRATIRWPNGLFQSVEKIPINHRIAINEGVEGFQAEPFRSRQPVRNHQDQAAAPNSLPSSSEAWLIEPLRAPAFTLPDSHGETRSLSVFLGKPLVLLIVSSACERSRDQLTRFSRQFKVFGAQSIGLAALSLDAPTEQTRLILRAAGVPFPVFFADETAAGVYNILYRYLFDRRRDLETPLTLLIDAHGAIVKVHLGAVDPLHVLKDCTTGPQSNEERLHAALPFSGLYYGAVPRRNYFTYGIAYVQNEYLDAAVTCFQNAIAANPNNAAAYYNLGTIYLNKQMVAAAKTNLERAVILDPNDADAWTNLGAVAGQQKNYDQAFQCFQRALRANPTHLLALQNLVMLYRWQGRLDLAEHALQNAIAAEPGDAEFHFALGMLLAAQEKFEDARNELERTMELRPGDTIALNNLGVVYLRLGRQAQALDDFERCTQMAPDYDRPYLNIALVYQQSGQNQKAADTLQGFLARHPDNVEVKKAFEQLAR